MPTIRYDDRSYFIDDRRLWLCSGSVHYFRTPHQLWRDRLLKAKRAGLNCIDTYVAWNFHEMQEGKWDFAGDRDVAAFVRTAGELGLYVILRPGPYICSEWDFGGLPAWLSTKSGISYRVANATYMHYLDKYLGQVLRRLSDQQVTRGGNIILIQNENEYVLTPMPDRLNYCQFISQLFQRAGFDIPVITCNYASLPQIPHSIECWNTWGDEIQSLKRLRAFQPHAPMLMTEFWDGWFDYWGQPKHSVRPAREVARRALEITGCGGQYNYYMWHGGTNFAFWASRLIATDASYQTTSYDFDAPLAEGGGLTPKYYMTRLVNLFATHFGAFIAQGKWDASCGTVTGGTQALTLNGPAGKIIVVTNNGDDKVTTAKLSLPDGKRELEVPLAAFGAVAIPVDIRLSEGVVLNHANVMPLGLFGQGNLVLHGPAGWEARISINGSEIRHKVPEKPLAEALEHQGVHIVLVNSELAQRCWEHEGSLIIGPDFLGEGEKDVIAPAGARQYQVLMPDGQLHVAKYPSAAPAKREAPKLSRFARVWTCMEPAQEGLTWQKIDRPKDLAALGVHYGYGWYRLEVDSPRAAKVMLCLSECEDRATIFLNGQSHGVWGRGPDATREPIATPLKRGRNSLVFLADNLGRDNLGPNLGSPKGIFGPIWDAQGIAKKFKLHPDGEFHRRLVPRLYSHMVDALAAKPLWRAEMSFSLSPVKPVLVTWTGVEHDVAVLCNQRQAIFQPACGGHGQVLLQSELQRGGNKLELLLWGDVKEETLSKVRLYQLGDLTPTSGTWSFRRWEAPQGSNHVAGKDLPGWFRCEFPHKPAAGPLFLHMGGAGKGQIYLNGHNIGRYWNLPPQQRYYLPEPWLSAKNVLQVFDERGIAPTGCRLEYCGGGPYGT